MSHFWYIYLQKYIRWKWKKYNKVLHYFLTKHGYPIKINLNHFNLHEIRWKLLFWVWKNYYFLEKSIKNLKLYKKILNKNINKISEEKNYSRLIYKWILSKSLSNWYTKLFLNLNILKKFKKINKFFKFLVIKKDSFRWIFWFEDLVVYETLLFWKSIINLSDNFFSFLSESELFLYNYNNLINYYKLWRKLINIDDKNLSSEFFWGNFSFLKNKKGFGDLRLVFFEKLLLKFKDFFNFNNSFFFEHIIFLYKDTLNQHSIFLPKFIWIKLNEIINTIYLKKKMKFKRSNW